MTESSHPFAARKLTPHPDWPAERQRAFHMLLQTGDVPAAALAGAAPFRGRAAVGRGRGLVRRARVDVATLVTLAAAPRPRQLPLRKKVTQ